jgi:aspartyl-tRNA(Asn)/glutamyl-tRNA(Gln) amidotransferase subunit B
MGAISDESAIEDAARKVIDANAKAVADYRSGKTAAIQALVGQVMKETRGRARPDVVRAALERLLA